METLYKEVDFKKYCELCIHKDVEDNEDPCDECLTYPCMEHSRKPLRFKENKN